jgi:hypothetical protein
MKGFYSSLLRTGDLDKATSAAQQRDETFPLYSAKAAFMRGWRKALEQFPTGKEDSNGEQPNGRGSVLPTLSNRTATT